MIITKDVDKKETKSNRVLLLIYESVKLDVRAVVHKSSKDKICLCMNNRFILSLQIPLRHHYTSSLHRCSLS